MCVLRQLNLEHSARPVTDYWAEFEPNMSTSIEYKYEGIGGSACTVALSCLYVRDWPFAFLQSVSLMERPTYWHAYRSVLRSDTPIKKPQVHFLWFTAHTPAMGKAWRAPGEGRSAPLVATNSAPAKVV